MATTPFRGCGSHRPAPTGFAEGQALFEPQKPKAPKPLDKQQLTKAADAASPIQDDELRNALEHLCRNILSKTKH